MKEKNQVVPNEVLSKEFLSQFKTEADVSAYSGGYPFSISGDIRSVPS